MSSMIGLRSDTLPGQELTSSNLDPLPLPGLDDIYAALVRTVQSRGVAMLVGQPNSGKSMVLRSVAATLRDRGTPAAVLAPGQALPSRLQVLLMDDAHLLDQQAWLQVARRAGAVVVAGLPSLRNRQPGLRRRVSLVTIPAIGPAAVVGFVSRILRQAGEQPSLIPPSSLAAIGEHAGSQAGRIAAIVRLAIFVARLEGAPTVEPHHVRRAAALSESEAEPDEVPGWEGPPAPRLARVKKRLVVLGAAVGLTVLSVPLTIPARFRPVIQTPPSPVQEAAAVLPSPRPTALPLPLPDPPTTHVAVLFAPDDVGAKSFSTTLVLLLRNQGIAVADPEPSRATSGGTELRYYFAEDAGAATDLAHAAGLNSVAVRLADIDPRKSLRPGTIEIVTGRSGR